MFSHKGNLPVVHINSALRQFTITNFLRIFQQIRMIYFFIVTFSSNENTQIIHISQLFLCQKTITCSWLSSSCSSTTSMDEKLHFSRKVVMNDILQKRDVKTTCCEVSNKKKCDKLFSEHRKFFFTSPLIHGTKDESTFESRTLTKFKHVFTVIPRCSKDNSLLTF